MKTKYINAEELEFNNDDIVTLRFVNNLERQLTQKFSTHGGYSRQLHQALRSIKHGFQIPNDDFQKSLKHFTNRGQRFFGHFPDFK